MATATLPEAATVLLVDDHGIFCEALQLLLERKAMMRVVGSARDGDEAVRLARELTPDVVLMDVALPKLDGISATRRIVAAVPGVKVIGLSGYPRPELAAHMLKAGACGFVVKESAYDELVDAIAAALEGRTYVAPQLAGDEVHQALEEAGRRSPLLSPRETEVLQGMAAGRGTKEIALALRLSVKTIETHRRNLMEKLRIYNVADLTKYAIRHGLASVN
jgi:two-component system, NarL family, response regulator NreC